MTHHLCERCGQEIAAEDRTVIHAVKIELLRRSGGIDEVEGRGALFHDRCWDEGDPNYHRKPHPDVKQG
jgi:hypothetical protein